MRTQAIPDCRYCPDPNRIAATSGALFVNALAVLALMIPIAAIEIPKLTIVKPVPKIEATLYPKQQQPIVRVPSPIPPRPHQQVAPVRTPVAVPVPVAIPVEIPTTAAPPIDSFSVPVTIETIPTTPDGDVQLVPKSMPKPIYPRAELVRGIEGEVLVHLRVNRDGVPTQIRVERSSGSPNLDRAALDAARKWRFMPTMQAGAAVEAEGTVPVRFSILSG